MTHLDTCYIQTSKVIALLYVLNCIHVVSYHMIFTRDICLIMLQTRPTGPQSGTKSYPRHYHSHSHPPPAALAATSLSVLFRSQERYCPRLHGLLHEPHHSCPQIRLQSAVEAHSAPYTSIRHQAVRRLMVDGAAVWEPRKNVDKCGMREEECEGERVLVRERDGGRERIPRENVNKRQIPRMWRVLKLKANKIYTNYFQPTWRISTFLASITVPPFHDHFPQHLTLPCIHQTWIDFVILVPGHDVTHLNHVTLARCRDGRANNDKECEKREIVE